jgi:predicted Zn-dependent peptidase
MNEISRIKLSSGLTILFEKRNLPVVSLVLATKGGAAFENEKNKGLAHFFEHMVFKGSKTRGQKEISSAIEGVGGEWNAFTSEQMTFFYVKLPSKHLEVSEVIFDMLANPKIDPKELERERGVILQEFNMVHDQPMRFLFDKMKEISYEKPFAFPILGFKKNILSFKREDFFNWHDSFYQPENLIVSVVGNADFSKIISLCKEFFGKSQKKESPQLELKPKNSKFLEKRKHIDQAHLGYLFHIPTLRSREKYTCDVMNAILGGGMSSRLFQEVREKRGLAYTARSYLEQERDYGYCLIYAGVEKKNVKKTKEVVLDVVKGMKKISSKEVEQAKEQCIGKWNVQNEQSDATATNLFLEETVGKAEDYYRYPEFIRDVTLSDVLKLVRIKKLSEGAIIPA